MILVLALSLSSTSCCHGFPSGGGGGEGVTSVEGEESSVAADDITCCSQTEMEWRSSTTDLKT